MKTETIQLQKHFDRNASQANLKRWRAGAAAGFIGGILFVLVGFVLTAISWFSGAGAADSNTNPVGTWLIVATIPAVMFGAHCLDKIEQITKAERIRYCTEYGMSDEQCANLDGK